MNVTSAIEGLKKFLLWIFPYKWLETLIDIAVATWGAKTILEGQSRKNTSPTL